MTDDLTADEAAAFYADPVNQRIGERVVARRALASSIPVRFPHEIVKAVRSVADAEGMTVSEWIRGAVTDALTARQRTDDPALIVEELRRDLDRLAATIR